MRSAAVIAAAYKRRANKRRKGSVSASVLRDEGVVEIGRVSAVAYVLTEVGLHLFHVDTIRDWRGGGR